MICSAKSYQLQFIGLHLHGSGLGNKIKPKQHRCHPVALFHIPLDATQRTGFHLNLASRADARRQKYLQLRLQSPQNLHQLLNEQCLVMNNQQIGQIIILKNPLPLLRLKLEKHVPRKQEFLEGHGFPSVSVCRSIERQGHRNSLPFAVLFHLLLSPRTRVRHEPFQISHCNHYDAGARARVKPPESAMDPYSAACPWRPAGMIMRTVIPSESSPPAKSAPATDVSYPCECRAEGRP